MFQQKKDALLADISKMETLAQKALGENARQLEEMTEDLRMAKAG